MNIPFDQASYSTLFVDPCLYLPLGLPHQMHSESRDMARGTDWVFPTSWVGSSGLGGDPYANFVEPLSTPVQPDNVSGGYSLPAENPFSAGSNGLSSHNPELGNSQNWGIDGNLNTLDELGFESLADENPPFIDDPATADHGPANSAEFVCNDCSKQFPHKSALDNHAKAAKHGAYKCVCGVTFTRHDVLDRHIRTRSGQNLYHCTYCSKSFVRSDHLTQHLRGYHRMEVSTGSSMNPRLGSNTTGNTISHERFCSHENCCKHQGALLGNQPRAVGPSDYNVVIPYPNGTHQSYAWSE